MLQKLRGMFKTGHSVILLSPIEGETAAISEVPDSTFNEEILGRGFAIRPAVGRVVAPFDGEVTLVFDTLHALMLLSEEGMELLIHIGIETVALKGAPYKAHVSAGDKVKAGDLLMEFDIGAIRDAGCDTICPVVITNSDHYMGIEMLHTGAVKELDPVMKLT